MRFPITATIESARFSARIHSALTTYKKREEVGGLLLVVRLRNGDTLEWIVLHEGTKKRGTFVYLSLSFIFVILLLGHRQLLVSLCRCLI